MHDDVSFYFYLTGADLVYIYKEVSFFNDWQTLLTDLSNIDIFYNLCGSFHFLQPVSYIDYAVCLTKCFTSYYHFFPFIGYDLFSL